MSLQFYGYLSQQQNMMQDYVRTGTYQRAILQNHTDFKDKVTLNYSANYSFIIICSLILENTQNKYFWYESSLGRVQR